MDAIRVVVIDDSAFMRKMISDILTSDNRIKVIGTARNGADGVKKVQTLKPDVLTLDIEMPVMDGITALQELMLTNPTPIVMLSSETKAGAAKTLRAISGGAVDFITKPSGAISLDINTMKKEIIMKVITASRANVKKVESSGVSKSTLLPKDALHKLPYDNTIVAIGASTGGPRALQQVLTDLPADFSTPILIVQHMPARFTKSLADRLNSLVDMHVKEANHGEIIQKKTVYIAPGDFHVKVRKVGTALALELTKDTMRHGHRPAVDVLFESLAQMKKVNKIAVILTGMGSDGATGVIQLKETDANTIVLAESEETAIVYGMPKAAVKTNYVNQSIPLQQVGSSITSIVEKSGGM